MRYAVVIETSETGYGAYVPDLPGCVAVGETLEETNRLVKEAIDFHLEAMHQSCGGAVNATECASFFIRVIRAIRG